MNFDNCVPKSSLKDLQKDLVSVLSQIELAVGFELNVNSAFRPVDWELSHGRTGTSSHCKGLAADIKALTSQEKFMIVQAAIGAGVKRIGVYKTFVHVDVDNFKPQHVIWYGE